MPASANPGVPPTNNQAERSLRPVVIMLKVIQGTRSQQGLENHGVIRCLFETAKRQDKKPHRFLLEQFTKSTTDAQTALYAIRWSGQTANRSYNVERLQN